MIKIFLVDDQYLMLEGIKAILRHDPQIEVVGTAQDGISAIALVRKLKPDIVLIDIEMPKIDGIKTTRYICQYLPKTKVIVLTSHSNHIYMTKALEAGASSYLLKDSLVEDLRQGIYSLSRGYSYIDSKLLTQAVNKIQTNNIVSSSQKKTYLKKYRKKVYSPDIVNSPQKSSIIKAPVNNLSNSKKSEFGINKANLDAIFEITGAKPQKTNNRQPVINIQRKNLTKLRSFTWRKTNSSKIIWLLMGIASSILVIFIF